jgi:histone H3/H4
MHSSAEESQESIEYDGENSLEDELATYRLMLEESRNLENEYGLRTDEDTVMDIVELDIAAKDFHELIEEIKEKISASDTKLETKETALNLIQTDRLSALTVFDVVSGEAEQEDTLVKRLISVVNDIGDDVYDLTASSTEAEFAEARMKTAQVVNCTDELVAAKPSLKRTRKNAEALEEITKTQESVDHQIGRNEFGPVVTELCGDFGCQFTPAAMDVIQTAAEDFLTNVFDIAGDAAATAGRDEITLQDLECALKRRKIQTKDSV